MSIKDEYISVKDFALLTGMVPKDIVGKFTVEIGGRHLVPRFMLADKKLNEVEHIELPVDEQNEPEEYTTVARLDVDLTEFRYRSLSIYELASARAAGYPVESPEEELGTSESDTATDASSPDEPDPHDETIDVSNYIASYINDHPASPASDTSITTPSAEAEPRQTDDDTLAESADDSLDISLQTQFGDESARPSRKKRRRSSSTSRHKHKKLNTQVSPVRRLGARTMDLIWQCALILICLYWAWPYFGAAVAEISLRLRVLIVPLLTLPAALLLDSAVHALARNTPGKFALGLKVVSRRHKSVNFSKHLTRNLYFWHSAMAYGLIPLTIICLIREGSRIGSGRETHYDEKSRTRVGHKQQRTLLEKAIGYLLFTATMLAFLFTLGWSLPTVMEFVAKLLK